MDMEAAVVKAEPTYLESSANGALMVELDAQGEVLRVQIEPDVMASWSATVLADRITRLHRLALMRSRAARLVVMNEQRAKLAPTRAWPSRAEVDEFRRSINF
jgi:DNA-binding protein YbaB